MGFFALPRCNWRRMAVIVRKELLVLFCNRVSRALLIVPPLMEIVVFGWAATMEVRNVDLAVLNHDSGNWSREILRAIQGSPTFRKIICSRECAASRASCCAVLAISIT